MTTDNTTPAPAPESGDPAAHVPAPVEQPAPVETPAPQDPADPPAPTDEPATDPAAPAVPEPQAAASSLKARVLSAFRDKSALVAELKSVSAKLAVAEKARGELVAEAARLAKDNAKLGADLDASQKALAALQAERRDVEALVAKQVAAELAALGHPAEDLPGTAAADAPDASDHLAVFNSLKGAARTAYFKAHEAAIVKAQRGNR